MARTMVGKIELRTEPDFLVATYMLPGSGAFEIARIRITLVENNEVRRKAFQQLVSDAVSDLIRDAGGVSPSWHEERPA